MKIKIMLSAFLLAALLQTGFAQKRVYDANAQVRSVGGFTSVVVSNAIDLYLSMGNEDAVAVSIKNQKYIDRITTEVKNGILYIGAESNGIGGWGGQEMKAYVSIKSISKLKATGACNVIVDGTLSSQNLAIDLSGATDFKGDVNSQNIRLEASGSSDIHISGKATNANIKVSGASDVKGYDFSVDNCDIEASGSSDVNITVNKELKADASGASDINYKGDPTVKKANKSGSSDIKKVGGKNG